MIQVTKLSEEEMYCGDSSVAGAALDSVAIALL